MSPIIKATQTSGEPAEFAFADLGDPARSDVKEARRRAAILLAEAETQASELCRQAEEQSRAALAAAQQAVDAEVGRQVDSLVRALTSAVDEIRAAKTGWMAHWERAAVELATAIAARVLRREIERTPEVTLNLVREALELAAGSADVQLRLHPDDLATLGPQLDRLLTELGRLGQANVVADEQITRGGCRVDTRYGTIDQQFEAQLARIAQEFA